MVSSLLSVALNTTKMLPFFCSESHSTETLMEKSVISHRGARCDNSSAQGKEGSVTQGCEH